MGVAIQTAMNEETVPAIMHVPRPDVDTDMTMSRTEKIGSRWRVRDDALWNPFEVIFLIAWIVLGFGFLLGHGNYAYVATLFLPVILFAVVVVLAQAVLRWKAGETSVFGVMRERIGLGT